MKKEKKYIFLFMIFLIIIDIISKLIVVNILKDNTFVIIKNFLKFTYVKNIGAAFGILSGNTVFLIIISLLFICYIYKEMKDSTNNKLTIFSYLLILSGAIGNLIDRIFRGFVVDFISFRLFGREMAVFNLADSYITIGVILLLITLLKEYYYGRNNHKW